MTKQKTKVKFTPKQKIIRAVILTITIALTCFGLYMTILFNESHNIYQKIQSSQTESSSIKCKTWLPQVYISEDINVALNSKNTSLVIEKDNYLVSISPDYTGILTLPQVSSETIKLYGEEYESVKVSFSNATHFSNIAIKKGNLPHALANREGLDIYTKENDGFTKTGNTQVSDLLSVSPCNCYLTYVPVTEIITKERLTLYKGVATKPEFTVIPEYATNTNVKFEDFDSNYLTFTDENLIIGNNKGNTSLTYVIDGIQKNISVNILPTVEKISVNKRSTKIKLNNWSYVIATFEPNDAVNTELIWTSSDENVAIVENGMIKSRGIGTCTVTVSTKYEPYVSATIRVEVVNNSGDYRYKQGEYGYPTTIIEGPYYINGILVVNKKYSIPENFANGINNEALAALTEMQKEATKQGLSLPNISDFRSYATQKQLYQSYIIEYGINYANTYSARPGHSEHSSGLAFDIGNINYAYGLTASGRWLSENCHKFGFIIRYPKGKESITGYNYEPWHIRYVGKENALKIYNSGLCLEEFLKLN